MNKTALYTALHRIRTQPELNPLVTYAKEQLEACKDALVEMTSDTQFARLQGRAQAWKQLLYLIEQSTSLLDKER